MSDDTAIAHQVSSHLNLSHSTLPTFQFFFHSIIHNLISLAASAYARTRKPERPG